MLELHQRRAECFEIDLPEDDCVVSLCVDLQDVDVCSIREVEEIIKREPLTSTARMRSAMPGMVRACRSSNSRSSVDICDTKSGKSSVASTVYIVIVPRASEIAACTSVNRSSGRLRFRSAKCSGTGSAMIPRHPGFASRCRASGSFAVPPLYAPICMKNTSGCPLAHLSQRLDMFAWRDPRTRRATS